MSYIQNYVEIKITGEKPQKFINICLRRRLAVWRLTRVSEHEFTLFLLAGDFKKNVRSAARKSHVKVKILKKKGLIYTLRRYRARKTLLILSVLLAALFCMMSSMVWSIRIEGGDAADRGDEIQILSAVGIICVCGKNLEITEINDEYISIKGCIDRIAYKD